MFVSLAAGFYLHRKEILKMSVCDVSGFNDCQSLAHLAEDGFRRLYETQLCAKKHTNLIKEKVKSSVEENEMSVENKRERQVERSDDAERGVGPGAA